MEHRKIINKEVELELEREIKEVKVQFDGRQFLIKIPKDFSDMMRLKKKDKIRLTFPTPEGEDLRKSRLSMEVV